MAPVTTSVMRGPCTFTLRVWREGRSWRGQVVHVQSGQTLFFEDADRMWSFIRARAVARADESLFGEQLGRSIVQEESHAKDTSS